MAVSTVLEIVDIPVAEGSMRGYAVRPGSTEGAAGSADEAYPSIIVIQEAFGVNNNIQRITRRIASEGFFAIAPVLFHRKGANPVAQYGDMETVGKYREGLTNDLTAQDIGSVIDFMDRYYLSDAGNVGIIGFCMGGTVSFLGAVTQPRIKASAVFYGGGIVNPPAEGGTPLVERAGEIKGSVMGFFGGQDQMIPPDHVDKIRDTLKGAGLESEVHYYPDAGHGFFCDDRESYNEAAANDSWEKALVFFNKHLKGK
jgi:carboxymethylenebutenolidase